MTILNDSRGPGLTDVISDSDFLCLMSAYVSGFVTCVYTCKFSSLTVRARVGSNFLELAVEELPFLSFISKIFN